MTDPVSGRQGLYARLAVVVAGLLLAPVVLILALGVEWSPDASGSVWSQVSTWPWGSVAVLTTAITTLAGFVQGLRGPPRGSGYFDELLHTEDPGSPVASFLFGVTVFPVLVLFLFPWPEGDGLAMPAAKVAVVLIPIHGLGHFLICSAVVKLRSLYGEAPYKPLSDRI